MLQILPIRHAHENSRGKVQNVRADSSVNKPGVHTAANHLFVGRQKGNFAIGRNERCGRFFFSRSSLAMDHFFSSAGQLRTTVIGGDPASSDVFSRKRRPSAETPYDCRSAVTLSSV
jgi:hypothetical protein